MPEPVSKNYKGIENVVQDLKSIDSLANWDPDKLVEAAQLVARELKKSSDLSTQIYRFLTSVRKIELQTRGAGGAGVFERKKVVLLKPKFVYAVSKKPALRPLYQVIEAATETIKTDREKGYQEFQQLITFIEAVVAYYGYKEEGEDHGRAEPREDRSTPRGQDPRSRPDPAANRPADRGRQGRDWDRRPR